MELETKTKMQEIRNLIVGIDDADALREIGTLAYQRSKEIKEFTAGKIDWQIDQKVQLKQKYQNSKPYDMIGTIVKVNKVKCKVRFGIHEIWNIPKTIMTIVG